MLVNFGRGFRMEFESSQAQRPYAKKPKGIPALEKNCNNLIKSFVANKFHSGKNCAVSSDHVLPARCQKMRWGLSHHFSGLQSHDFKTGGF